MSKPSLQSNVKANYAPQWSGVASLVDEAHNHPSYEGESGAEPPSKPEEPESAADEPRGFGMFVPMPVQRCPFSQPAPPATNPIWSGVSASLADEWTARQSPAAVHAPTPTSQPSASATPAAVYLEPSHKALSRPPASKAEPAALKPSEWSGLSSGHDFINPSPSPPMRRSRGSSAEAAGLAANNTENKGSQNYVANHAHAKPSKASIADGHADRTRTEVYFDFSPLSRAF